MQEGSRQPCPGLINWVGLPPNLLLRSKKGQPRTSGSKLVQCVLQPKGYTLNRTKLWSMVGPVRLVGPVGTLYIFSKVGPLWVFASIVSSKTNGKKLNR